MMARFFPPVILLLLVAFQGINYLFIPVYLTNQGFTVVIHGVFVFLVLVTLYYDLESSYYGVLYAMIAGLMMDIVYTGVLGVYMFSYAITIYLLHSLRKLLHVNIYVTSFLMLLGLAVLELLLYRIYTWVGYQQIAFTDYINERFIYTLIVNMVVYLIFFVLFKKRLLTYSTRRFEETKFKN
ncbi:rod shape-determining protein MreD [Streptohalobacillus salinus]|uniref:Rod shape-determining protein MreD n=1 Tax=Streptohalobacillus salinus TaxID=621096 RepID=A0A2V3W6N3_9BACI|nr:rod shape-determining protein MreD [Streptohalobacillus salinus]PXW90023.1 rod shape-determining protein MreD [Streptohalobacillus salinus]